MIYTNTWTRGRPALNPPRKCIRLIKVLLFLTPTLGFVFFTLMQQQEDHGVVRRKGKMPLDLETVVQRDHMCDNWGVGNTNRPNETVVRICEKLDRAQQVYYRLQRERVNPYPHQFLISAPHICRNDTEIIVLIHSLHDHMPRRMAIRNTWGGAVHRKQWPRANITANVKVAFVFGIHRNETWNAILRRESEYYGDVIQGDFMEHYHNMTLKSQLGLKWVAQECACAKYLIKSDDDMIINFPELLRVLGRTNMTRGIMGPYNPVSKANRSGKWGIHQLKFPFYYFPPYESGSAYVISGDLVRPLFDASEHVPPIFIDDVYITGILGRILGVRHLHQEGFSYWTDKRPRPCSILQNKILTGTKLHNHKDLLKLWKSIVQGVDCTA